MAALRRREVFERRLQTIDDAHRCIEIFSATWGRSPMTFDTLRALQLGAGQLQGTVTGNEVIGAAVGFYSLGDGGDNHLFSHAVAVHPDWRNRGIGRRLKEAQRVQTRREGFDQIRWTFDPLRVANANFNFNVLGAQGIRYLPDYYGALDDDLNSGAVTDRILVRWDTSDADPPPKLAGSEVRIEIPIYWESPDLTAQSARLAQAEFAESMQACLTDGLVVTGFDRHARAYVFSPGE